jgi:hypothetical protein
MAFCAAAFAFGSLGRRRFAGQSEHAVCVCEPDVCECVRRINRNRLAEIGKAGLDFCVCILDNVVTPFEIKPMRFRVGDRRLRRCAR